jgi:toxin ParE1/3/4
VARFHLTGRAAQDLHDIHGRSVETWGVARADRYLADVYAVCDRVATKPELGRFRSRRSAPFLMIPAGRHFIVYDRSGEDVVVLTVLHQARDIEAIIANLEAEFLAQIAIVRGDRDV